MNSSRIFLLLAQTLFLWTFLSTQGVERMADAGLLAGPAEGGLKPLVYAYASRWRHGFCGFWPLYMPGFFAVAIAGWYWSFGRPLRRLLPEGLAILSAAMVCAFLFSSAGQVIFLSELAAETGIIARATLGPDFRGVAAAAYTLIAWSAVVLATHRAIWWHSWKPLIIPALLEAILLLVRPFVLDSLWGDWWRGLASGDYHAIVSLAAVPAVSAVLIWSHLVWQRRHGKPLA